MKDPILRAAAGMAALLGASGMMAAPLPSPMPPTPPAAQLMALAFPGWRDDEAGRLQTATLPHLPGGAHGSHSGWRAGANRVLAVPGPVLRIDATHLMLIAGLVPAAPDGSRAALPQLTPMALAAWRFERRGSGWRVSGSQDVFALRGFAGSARLHAAALSRRHQGVAVEYGSCFDGYCGTWLALYELDKGTMRHAPVVELALAGDNVEGSADCAPRLQPLFKPQAAAAVSRGGPAAPDAHDCYAIESSWAIDTAREQPGDLTIRYQGAMSRAQQHPAAPEAIDQRQVLRYESGRYRAVSGFNPVPPI